MKYESSSYFEAQGNFIIIKQGSSIAALWTPDEIGKEEQSKILDIILNNNYDPSISSVSFSYISGVGSHDLSYLGKNWGIYNIGYNNGLIQLECDKERISHLNVGNYEYEKELIEEVIPKFKVSGTKTRDVSCDKYNVSGKRIESVYENTTEYLATVYKSPIIKTSNYRIYGQYIIKEEENVTNYKLSGEISKLKEKKLYSGLIEYKAPEKNIIPNDVIPDKQRPSDNHKINQSCDGENPKMGDDSNIYLAGSVLCASALGLMGSVAYYIDETNTKKKILK